MTSLVCPVCSKPARSLGHQAVNSDGQFEDISREAQIREGDFYLCGRCARISVRRGDRLRVDFSDEDRATLLAIWESSPQLAIMAGLAVKRSRKTAGSN